MKPLTDGLLHLMLFATMLLAGCASQPQQVPVAVPCPRPAKPPDKLRDPPKTLYLLPKESLPTAQKRL